MPNVVRLIQGALYRVWQDDESPVVGVLETWDPETGEACLTVKDGAEIWPRIEDLEEVQ